MGPVMCIALAHKLGLPNVRGRRSQNLDERPNPSAATRKLLSRAACLIAMTGRMAIPLMRDETAIDVESLSGDVARARRREEHDHRRDVLGLVGAAQRNAVRAAPFDLLDARALRFGDHANHLGIKG